jgi:hypothetical protein
MTDFDQAVTQRFGGHAAGWDCPIKPLIQKPRRMRGALAIDNNADADTPADASQVTRESGMFAG